MGELHSGRPALVISALDALNPKHLTHLSPETNRRVSEAGFICIDQRPLPEQISLVRLDKLGLLDKLPDEVEGRDHDLHSVV